MARTRVLLPGVYLLRSRMGPPVSCSSPSACNLLTVRSALHSPGIRWTRLGDSYRSRLLLLCCRSSSSSPHHSRLRTPQEAMAGPLNAQVHAGMAKGRRN
ncbi:hypothetical protein NDU88_004909 [Pleurodeles waltl]|uniref:Uncharacterized protein n=1 Tax=Pleurodeles waltl TaxID=8319 RepID=A0AAV7UIE3_PLEWA|nr:hypothetical protein NDU88_004909 [Pleurodeles waltl]